ncbi:MAG: hypothetical protein AAF215_01105 [Cyanobacteria bacterium P01_A01_bin.123]
MNSLNSLTSRRLNRLPKHPSVWEGDRRSIGASLLLEFDADSNPDEPNGDCILWVDGTQGMVRGISVVPAETGHEAVVRTLLQAMESPQGPAEPSRPQKIVVRDREIHFFLRGALQDVDIDIEYVPTLPLIDEIFEGLMQQVGQSLPNLPEIYADDLMTKASQLWQDAPWNVLNEQQILAIEVNRWDIETLYISVLGMAGVEYGVLMYRSLESLRQFRQRVLGADQAPKKLQQAFLEQDCLFLNFELLEEQPDPEVDVFSPFWTMQPTAIQPEFGSLHPLEGLRTVLADEEAATFIAVLEAMHRFFSRHYAKFDSAIFPALEGRYRIPNPMAEDTPSLVPIKVKTLPDVATVLLEETAALEEEIPGQAFPMLRDDYVPEGALIMLRSFSDSWLQYLRKSYTVYHQALSSTATALTNGLEPPEQDLPIVVIQTSRPKALDLIENLKQADGITAVCFNWGTDPLTGEEYDLGLLQTGNGEFHLFGEFSRGDRTDQQLVAQWQRWQARANGYCGVVIAGGITGASKGEPQLNQMLGFFETRLRSPEDLNLTPLQLQVAVDWEADF